MISDQHERRVRDSRSPRRSPSNASAPSPKSWSRSASPPSSPASSRPGNRNAGSKTTAPLLPPPPRVKRSANRHGAPRPKIGPPPRFNMMKSGRTAPKASSPSSGLLRMTSVGSSHREGMGTAEKSRRIDRINENDAAAREVPLMSTLKKLEHRRDEAPSRRRRQHGNADGGNALLDGRQVERQALLANNDIDDASGKDIYAQMEEFGMRLDAELSDLEKLGVSTKGIPNEIEGGTGWKQDDGSQSQRLETPNRRSREKNSSQFRSSPATSDASSSQSSLPSPSRLSSSSLSPPKYARRGQRRGQGYSSGAAPSLAEIEHGVRNSNYDRGIAAGDQSISFDESRGSLGKHGTVHAGNRSDVSLVRLTAKERYQMQKLRVQTLLQKKGPRSKQNQLHGNATDQQFARTRGVPRGWKARVTSEQASRQQHPCNQREYDMPMQPPSIGRRDEDSAHHAENYPMMATRARADGSKTNGAPREEGRSHGDEIDGASSTAPSSAIATTNETAPWTGDPWSDGIAAAVVAGAASRGRDSSLLALPRGRRAFLPIFAGASAAAMSLATLLSCRLVTISAADGKMHDPEGTVVGGGRFSNQEVFQLGPYRYLSVNPSHSDGAACLPYPSSAMLDAPFTAARSASALAFCLGCALVLWTCTLLCVPTGRAGVNGLGACFVLNAMIQCLVATLYRTEICDVGGECRPNRDLAFCVAAAALYVAAGWMLRASLKFTSGPVGHGSMEVRTWSSRVEPSHQKEGVSRTVEKCWTTMPDGSTMTATVFVEKMGSDVNSGSGKKTKTTYSIETDVLPA